MNWSVLCAIFKRNFVAYFSNPTGYVFICVFVLMSSFAAFWPNEFFNNNLANLDQLNKYLPYILLVFIPAITMSIWADERRQGTDELLLTIQAGDLDVVLGKYLAAVAIYTVALLFSMLANLWVLVQLGTPDMGLFFGTYTGYWFVGLAMLAVGMVASFLTGNLTVGFILGALFNAPLAFLDLSNMPALKRWSVAEQFRDFERGILSLSSISYFVMIVVVMLYLSMVLIGRRHWLGGRDGRSFIGHYIVRTLSLVAVAVGASLFFSHHDARVDVSSERLSSLSPDTLKLIAQLKTDHPVQIEAFISPQVPAEYVPTRLNLLSTLEELKSLGSGKINVTTHVIENFSDEAVLAEQKYDIKPRTIRSKERGAWTQKDIFLAAAFTCGLDKVVIPFVDKGIPVEYELVRSICTVAQPQRKKLGVLGTDVQLFGSFNMQSFTPSDDSLLVEELKKQYEVVRVDASSPIKDRYDVLLAAQPSSLTPQQMENFIQAIENGQPTAIFEDPFPLPNFYPSVAGTAQPRQQPPMMNFMMGGGRQPPEPKGDINLLWDMLGVNLPGDEIVWQGYNPYPKGQEFITPEWVFVDRGVGDAPPFNDTNPISKDLQQILFLFPGAWQRRNTSELEFTELATTGDVTGIIRYGDIMQMNRQSPVGSSLSRYEFPTGQRYVLVAHIRGKPKRSTPLASVEDEPQEKDDPTKDGGAGKEEEEEEEEKEEKKEEEKEEPEINVVLVSDIDCLASAFFAVRALGDEEEADITWDFDNVPFVLNVLDVLAGDDRFVEIRKRRRKHRMLVKVEDRTEESRREAGRQRQTFIDEFTKARDEEQAKFDKRIAEIEKDEKIDPRMQQIQMQIARNDGQRRLDVRISQLEAQRDVEMKKIDRNLSLEIQRVQDRYKMLAILIPPIPPLVVAFFVFFHRRQLEREGVAKSRLR